MGVQFFFIQSTNNFNKSFPNLWGGATSSLESKRAGKILEPYGWLNSLFKVSQNGVFNIKELDPIESVKRTNILRVFTYLSWLNAVNDAENKYKELMEEKQKRKQKQK